MSYDFRSVEARWQERWDAADAFAALRHPGRPKYFGYNPAPYLTGALHLGHVRNYTYGDFLARLMRLRGADVLYTIGFDAFGLPTEMAAIRKRSSPAAWSARCRDAMEAQLRRLGFGFDWHRSFITSDPDYYRWTQWIFLQLLADGLIYGTHATIDWCDRCDTGLARAQLADGRCSSCGGDVAKRDVREWRLRITPFLEDLLAGLAEIHDLNGLADEGQRSLIGRQQGQGVDLELQPGGARVRAFLADPADWEGDCVLVVDSRDQRTLAALGACGPGPLPGVTAREPATGREFPLAVVVARDPLFADQPRLAPSRGESREGGVPPLTPLTVFRQKDFSISRERLWGTPIPVVLCDRCGEVPLASEDLPLLAPEVIFDPAAGALRRADPGWGIRDCPRCRGRARLDPLVMDCHMDSLWHYYRPCAGASTDFMFDPAEVASWMPVDGIQFGRDVIPFMLDLRFFTRFLHARGLVPFREFCRETLAHGLVLHAGRKMSKHLGNVVDPCEIADRYGADSLRFYVLAHGDARSDVDWSESGIPRFAESLAAFHRIVSAHASGNGDRDASAGTPADGAAGFARHTRVFLGKVAKQAALLERTADERQISGYAAALRHLLEALQLFWNDYFARERDPRFAALWRDILRDAIVYLAPVAPHLAEECWMLLGESPSLVQNARWPCRGTVAT